MEKIPLLTTGANGLVGSKFVQMYQDKYAVDSLELSHPTNPVDITDEQAVMKAFAASNANTVIHLAAFTDVTRAWGDRGNKDGLVYKVNVVGTQNIIKACAEYNKHLIHISTAYIFDGEKEGMYVEDDKANPIEWYGQTKWEAEQAVMDSNIDWTILRIDQPFRSDPFFKVDIAHRIAEGLKANSLHPMFVNHFFGPTFIDDLAKIFDFFIKTKNKGIFHATNGEKWSDYEFAQALKNGLSLPGKVKKGDLDTYLQTLNRPYQKNTALNNEKLVKILPFALTPIKKALKQVEIS
jgi:dTDP-4-dehydrorhamnose reductase